jgi:hypothetical protein
VKIHSDVKNFKYVCSVQSEFMAVFMGFNLWIDQDLFLSLVVNFYFSIAIFLLLPLD